VATPNLLRRCNPAREYPEWFSQILPLARIGGQRLAAFVRLGFKRITDRASATMMVVVDRWFNGLPSVSRELLARPRRGGPLVSDLLQS
jgi:hypothetical protein